ncbi:hypothetical protein GTQ40_08180 [Flavobacteriaceae bacterium R38]|nr:hypothetical protein [Flavobacteriaceae bacterium R38]
MRKALDVLKSYFETGDKPTQEQFYDLFDSLIHKDEGRAIVDIVALPNGDIRFDLSDATSIIIPMNSDTSSFGLEAIDEGNGIGLRKTSISSDTVGNIGSNALDLGSYPEESSETKGATGTHSLTLGHNNIASNYASFAGGFNNKATNQYSFTYGYSNEGNGFADAVFGANNSSKSSSSNNGFNLISGIANEIDGINSNTILGTLNVNKYSSSTVVGQASEEITGLYTDNLFSTLNNNPNTPLFIVGNGDLQNSSTEFIVRERSNAFIVYKNGSIQLIPVPKSSIENAGPGSMIINTENNNHLEYFDGTQWIDLVGGAINPELHSDANAASVNNEVDSTTGWINNNIIDLSVESIDVDQSSFAIKGTANQSGNGRIGYSFPVENGEQYVIKWRGKKSAGADARLYSFSNLNGTQISMTDSYADYNTIVTGTLTGTATIEWFLLGAVVGQEILLDNLSIKKLV